MRVVVWVCVWPRAEIGRGKIEQWRQASDSGEGDGVGFGGATKSGTRPLQQIQNECVLDGGSSTMFPIVVVVVCRSAAEAAAVRRGLGRRGEWEV